MKDETGPGVPEALPRVLRMIGRRLGPEAMDRVWVFPPLVRGRREWGLVAVSRYAPEPGDADGRAGADPPPEQEPRRVLCTAPYAAERTGKGLHMDMTLRVQGEAPPDRLPRVMEGVVRRSGDELGDPREIDIRGDPDRFEALLDEFDPALFEEEARPLEPADP